MDFEKRLPKWFTYTNFRAFLRAQEVNDKRLGYIGDAFNCPLCSFIQENTGTKHVAVGIPKFQIEGKFYLMPLWAERWQNHTIAEVDSQEAGFDEDEDKENSRSASFYLNNLIITGARTNTGVR